MYRLLYLIILCCLWTNNHTYAQERKPFDEVLQELRQKFVASDYGFHNFFESIDNLKIDQRPNANPRFFILEDRRDDMRLGFDCTEVAINVYDVFRSHGYEVEIWEGQDQYGIWNAHRYAKVRRDDDHWVTVDFTPPYYVFDPFIDSKNPIRHQDTKKLSVDEIRNRSIIQLKRQQLITYRYFHKDNDIFLVKVGSCSEENVPYTFQDLIPFKDHAEVASENMPTYSFCSKVHRVRIDPNTDELLINDILLQERVRINMDIFTKAVVESDIMSLAPDQQQWAVWRILNPAFETYVVPSFVQDHREIMHSSRDGIVRYSYYVLFSAALWMNQILQQKQ